MRSDKIKALVQHIEKQLGLGSGQDWTNKDFETLSTQILAKTGKQLSVTTLKRLWGRAELIANPSQTSLNILAEFGGFASWRAFERSISEVHLEDRDPQRRNAVVWIAMPLLLVVAYFSVSALLSQSETKPATNSYDPTDLKFKSRVISNDLPNSVVFAYDATATAADAKIEIQQSWDDSKRIAVNRTDTIATCIYYKPGFFKAKLVVDSIIVLRDDVHIKTKDWLGLIQKETLPVYFTYAEINQGSEISITEDLLMRYDHDPAVEDLITSLYHVSDFGDIRTDNLDVSLEITNTHQSSPHRCRGAYTYLLFDGSAISVPLVTSGCIAEIDVMTFDDFVDGSTNDLSQFGVEFEAFQRLRFLGKGESLEIFLNDELVYTMGAPSEPIQLKGISVHFEGMGSIRNVKIDGRQAVN